MLQQKITNQINVYIRKSIQFKKSGDMDLVEHYKRLIKHNMIIYRLYIINTQNND